MISKLTLEKVIHLILVLLIYTLFTLLVIVPRDWDGNVLLILQYYIGISSYIIIFYCQVFWLFPKYLESKNVFRYFLLLTLIIIGVFLIHSSLQTIDFQKQGIKKYQISRTFFEAYFDFFGTHLRWVGDLCIVFLVSLSYSGIKLSLQKGLLKAKTLIISICIVLTVLFISIAGITFYNSLNNGIENIKFIENSDRFQKFQSLLDLEEFKGSILYIDIWGPNCGPCLQEFKYSKELKERYNNDPVKFIYLASLNRSTDILKWKNLIKKYQLYGYHLNISTDFYKNIWIIPGITDVYMIPHYIIVDKNGNITYPNAERPSSHEKLYKQLDDMINQ